MNLKLVHLVTSEAGGALQAALSRAGVQYTYGEVVNPSAKYVVAPSAGKPLGSADPWAVIKACHKARELGRGVASPDGSFQVQLRSSAERNAAMNGGRLPQEGQDASSRTSPRLKIATVLRSSQRWTPEIVKWFHRQVSELVLVPHEFVCLTDLPGEVPGGVALKHNWPGWWAKLELFRPGLWQPDDQVIYFDLDTVLLRPMGPAELPAIPPKNDLFMVSFGKGWWTNYGSGVMSFSGATTAPYEWFMAGPDRAMATFPSDQEVIASAIFAAGGRVSMFPGAIVQDHNGTEAIPYDRPPKATIFCAAGTGKKPFEIERPWIRPMSLPPTQPGLGLICCWYGDDPQRLAAAREGARWLARLNPRPEKALLVIQGNDPAVIPEWPWDVLQVPLRAESDGIWQKEVLWNIAGKRLTEAGCDKLVFCDIDTHQSPGDEHWLARIDASLGGQVSVLQPWHTVVESNGSTSWLSFSAQVAQGRTHGVSTGQGFCVAMTSQWFKACGGWPDWCVAGSGDAVAVIQWDVLGAHLDIYTEAPSMIPMIKGYRGPRTRYGYMPGVIIHEWHGDRVGPNQTRHYVLRHTIWDMIGGCYAVLHKGADGLWEWNDTALARAARSALGETCSRREEIVQAWLAACAKAGCPLPCAAVQ